MTRWLRIDWLPEPGNLNWPSSVLRDIMNTDLLIFLQMPKILQATSRGQVTLPKVWRDKYKTQYFISEVKGDVLVIKPLLKNDFEDSVESAWSEYKKGEYISSEELMKQYGL